MRLKLFECCKAVAGQMVLISALLFYNASKRAAIGLEISDIRKIAINNLVVTVTKIQGSGPSQRTTRTQQGNLKVEFRVLEGGSYLINEVMGTPCERNGKDEPPFFRYHMNNAFSQTNRCDVNGLFTGKLQTKVDTKSTFSNGVLVLHGRIEQLFGSTAVLDVKINSAAQATFLQDARIELGDSSCKVVSYSQSTKENAYTQSLIDNTTRQDKNEQRTYSPSPTTTCTIERR